MLRMSISSKSTILNTIPLHSHLSGRNPSLTRAPVPQIMAWSQSQVDYVLGKNNAGRSFMVGFGNNYPTRMHHRGASVPVTSTPYSCGEGYGLFYNTQNPDP